jgi:hypothetical protein
MTGCAAGFDDGCKVSAVTNALQSNGSPSYPSASENQLAIGWCANSGAPPTSGNQGGKNTDLQLKSKKAGESGSPPPDGGTPPKGWDVKSNKKM